MLMVVESKKNGEILQLDDILLHTFPIILKDIYMIRYLLKAENQHFFEWFTPFMSSNYFF